MVAVILFAMRFTIAQIAITIVFISSLYAKEVHSQEILNKTFSLSVENKQLKKIISDIQKQTGVHFSYSLNAINANRMFSVSADNTTIGDFLSAVLKPNEIGYEVVEKQNCSLSFIQIPAGC